jgi:N4-gp56 family major capsid protein
MALPTGATLTTQLANATIDRWMDTQLLAVAEKHVVLYNLGKRRPVPKGESKTVSFTRFERLTLPAAPLVEGVTPNATQMSTTRVTCMLEQWGAFVTLTDVAEMTVRYEPLQRAIELLGYQAAETLDREVLRQLLSGTNVFFGGSATSRAGLTATDVPTTTLLRKVRASLKNAGAPFYDGRYYAGVADPFNMMDLMADATFVQAATYQDKGVLTSGEMGVWMGIRWNESNVLPVVTANAAVDATVNTPAAAGVETALAAGTYFVLVTGNDTNGFETQVGPDAASTTTVASGDVIEVITPGAVAGVTSFNIYVGEKDGAVTTLHLQTERAPISTTYHITTNGLIDSPSATRIGVAYNTTERSAGASPAANVNVHYMFVFGSEYFAVTELEAVRTTRTPAGAQKGDELDQQRSVGWKAMFRACITNQSFGARIETESAFD